MAVVVEFGSANSKAWKGLSTVGLTPPSSDFYSVAATSASNAWAVGSYPAGSSAATLITHWNGKMWKQVRSPSPGVRAVATPASSRA